MNEYFAIWFDCNMSQNTGFLCYLFLLKYSSVLYFTLFPSLGWSRLKVNCGDEPQVMGGLCTQANMILFFQEAWSISSVLYLYLCIVYLKLTEWEEFVHRPTWSYSFKWLEVFLQYLYLCIVYLKLTEWGNLCFLNRIFRDWGFWTLPCDCDTLF